MSSIFEKLEIETLVLDALAFLVKEVKRLHREVEVIGNQLNGHKVRLSLTTSINHSKFEIMALQLNQGQFSLDTLQLIDSDTQQVVDATFANVSFTSDNPQVLQSVQSSDTPTQVTNTAISVGEANLVISADVTYTDSKTGNPVTKTLSLSVPFTVVAVATPENVELQLVQGTPQQS